MVAPVVRDRNVLSAETGQRLMALLGETHRPIPEARSRGRTDGRNPLLVRCTSATAAGASGVGAQCYPAVVVGNDATATSQPELGDVWLTLLGDGGESVQPVEDKLYHALLSGFFTSDDEDRPRTFAVAGGADGATGSCGTTCGTLAGLAGDEGLSFEVVCARGEFSAFDPLQETGGVPLSAAQFRPTGTGVWTLQYWNGSAWANFTFNWTGGTGSVVFTWNATLLPTLTIGGTSVTLLCLSADATFVGGRRNGLAGGGAIAADCEPNDIVFRVACDCLSLDGWQGPGFYCVLGAEEDCEGDDPSCVELIESDRCSEAIQICSGVYEDEEACECEEPACAAGPFELTFTGWTGDSTWMNDTFDVPYGGGDFDIAEGLNQGPVLDLQCTDGVYALVILDTDKTNIPGLCGGGDVTIAPTSVTYFPLTITFANVPGCWGTTDNLSNTDVTAVVVEQ